MARNVSVSQAAADAADPPWAGSSACVIERIELMTSRDVLDYEQPTPPITR